MSGIKLKLAPVEFPMLLYFLNTLFVGAALAIVIVLLMAVKDQRTLITELTTDLDTLHETIDTYRTSMQLYQKSFHEIESRFTRIEHSMWLSRGARLSAIRTWDEEFGEVEEQ